MSSKLGQSPLTILKEKKVQGYVYFDFHFANSKRRLKCVDLQNVLKIKSAADKGAFTRCYIYLKIFLRIGRFITLPLS